MTDASPSHYSVGDVEIIVVPDGYRTFPLPDNFVLNASRSELNNALKEASMPQDVMTIVFNPVVVRSSGKVALFDTGNGPQTGVSTLGRLHESLAAAGIAPEDITDVVISHFHSDHVSGLQNADGSLAFKNACIRVPSGEWAFWMDDLNMQQATSPRMQGLFSNNRRIFDGLKLRVDLYNHDDEVVSGVRAVSTPGHTLGHMSFMLSSGGRNLFLQFDVTNHPALFVTHPGWHPMFDQEPRLAEQTRRRIYEMLVSERIPVQGFHHPAPSISYVERTLSGYRLIPAYSL